MYILFVCDTLAGGGAQKLLVDLALCLQENGNKCDMLILSSENEKYADMLTSRNINVHFIPKRAKGIFKILKYICSIIKGGGYDLVHVNLFPATYFVSIAKRVLGYKCPPILMTEHSTDNRRRHKKILRPLEKFIYSGYAHIISISYETQVNLLRWLKKSEDEKRYSVIENGIDMKAFLKAVPYNKLDLVNNYQIEDILIGMIGSFTPQKNHKTMLEALSKLPSNYKLILIGEGLLEDLIKKKVQEMKLNERVFFLGFRNDVSRIMRTMDIISIPSLWEGFGLIAAEAMAVGIPIVASDVPGLSNIIGECGIKFEPTDSLEIAQAILKLEDKKLCKDLVDKGYVRVRKYDITRMADEYIDIFKKHVKNEVNKFV